MTPCAPGLICDSVPAANGNCAYPTPYSRYPGAYCFSPVDCISEDCNPNTCVGVSSGQPCTNHGQCEPKTYCLITAPATSGICTTQVDHGLACTEDADCTNDAICDNKVCIQMFSVVGPATTSVIWAIGLAPACATGYASGTAAPYTCGTAPTSQGLTDIPIACPESGVCTGTEGATKACTCNFEMVEYCPLFEGDTVVVNMISQWKGLFTASNGACSTVDRWSYACFAGQDAVLSDYVAFAANAALYLNNTWVGAYNDPVCVERTLMLDYSNLIAQETPTNTCPVFTCTNLTSNWPTANQCIFYNKNIFNSYLQTVNMVHPCPSGYTCPTNNGAVPTANVTCVANTVVLLNPGEYCTVGTQCLSSVCTSFRCTGRSVGATCSAASPCSVGLYCTTGDVCATLLANGAACTSSTQCGTYSACTLSFCVGYYTLATGTPTALDSGTTYGTSYACASGFANTVAGVVECAAAPVSQTNPPACEAGGMCADSTGEFSQSCQCSLNGKAYCPPFQGDAVFLNIVKNLKAVEASAVNCFNSELTAQCVMNDTSILVNYYYYYTNLTLFTDYAVIQDPDYCIQEVYLSEYYTALNYIEPAPPGPKPKSGGMAMAISALLLLAVNA